VTEGGRTEPNPVDDKGVVWGIPALNLISTRSEYIGTMGIPLVFDIVVYQVLIYYFHVWYPIAFAVSAWSAPRFSIPAARNCERFDGRGEP